MLTPIETVRAFWDEVWNGGDLSRIEVLVAEDFTLHSAGNVISPRDQFVAWVEHFQAGIDDLHMEVHDLFASEDGEQVVSRWTISGKHNGMMGIAPSHKPMSFTGITIFRVAEGRLQIGWVERSAFELYQHLTAN